MKIEIESISQAVVNVFYKNEFYGVFTNELELNDFRIKLLQNKCTDLYHLEFNNQKITFNELAELSEWPDGMYDETVKQYSTLFKLQKQKREELNRS